MGSSLNSKKVHIWSLEQGNEMTQVCEAGEQSLSHLGFYLPSVLLVRAFFSL